MKILYFHQYFSPPSGCFGSRPYEFAKHLIARGHSVTMVCGSHDRATLQLPLVSRGRREGMIDGIRVVEFDLGYSNHQTFLQRTRLFLRYAFRSAALALREDYDLLFASSTPLTASFPGIVMKLFRRKPFVFEVRDLWPELPKAMGVIRSPVVLALMSMLEKASYMAADGCIALAPGIAEGIQRRSRKNLPVVMIPNACDLDVFQVGKRAELELEGVAPSDFVAVFTGAHGVANGLGAVLDAAAVLKGRRRFDIKFVFIGDGKQKPHLQRRARQEDLASCLFFDPLPKQQLARLVGKADAGLMILQNVPAFYFGTSPNKFFDYVSAGLPVVTNYPGWVAELIRDHKCGIAVQPEDPDALADALIRMADDRAECARMGARARAFAESEFSRADLGGRFVDFLEARYASYKKQRNSAATPTKYNGE